MLLAVIAVFLQAVRSAKAQTPPTPGGVNDPGYTWIAWLQPENYDESTGTWANSITGTVGNFTGQNLTPPKINSGYNFYPAVRFPSQDGVTGTQYWLRSEYPVNMTASDNITAVFVLKRAADHNTYDHLLAFSSAFGTGSISWYGQNDDLSWTWQTGRRRFGAVTEGIIILDNANTATSNIKYYYNGANAGSGTNGAGGSYAAGQVIAIASGENDRGYYGFDGEMQEIILLKANGTENHLKLGDVEKIRSYLAVKYGISMADYIASNGTPVWNKVTNFGYDSHIFGIAHDDALGLYQKQSRSASLPIFTAFVGDNVTELNRDNNGTLPDGVYVMFGCNGSSPYVNNEIPDPDEQYVDPDHPGIKLTYCKSLAYRVQITGANAQRVKFKSSNITNLEYMLISDDPNFPKSSTAVIPFRDAIIEAELHDGDYISFGGFMRGPGGVTGNLKLWLRADDAASLITEALPGGSGNLQAYPDAATGTVVPAVSEWKDLMRGHTFSYRDGGGKQLEPVYQPSNYMTNFHPAVRFWSGASSATWLGNASGIWTSKFPTNNKHSAFFVVNNHFGSHDWVYPMMFGSASADSYNGPGYGVQRDNAKVVGRFRTSATQGEGDKDLFKPGATSMLGYHHSWSNTSTPPTGSSSVKFRFNGLEDTAAGISTGSFGLDQPSMIGKGFTNNRTIQGVMSEVIMYDDELPAASLQRIESYLALKYGVTLTPGTRAGRFDYLFSDGRMLWNGTSTGLDSIFYNRIAAVIRDDAADLHNRQSHSTDVGSILHMGVAGTKLGSRADVGDFGNDMEAVVWGDNNASGTAPVSLSEDCDEFDRVFNRKWRIRKLTRDDRPIRMIVGAENNGANQLGQGAGQADLDLFNILTAGYDVCMIVADDSAKLTPGAGMLDRDDITVVPMQYLDGEHQCSFDFTDAITYVTFGFKENRQGCNTRVAEFEGTKVFDWTQWTRTDYGAGSSIVKNTPVDLGDSIYVTKTSVTFDPSSGITIPSGYPSVTGSPVPGSLYLQRRSGTHNSKLTVTIEFEEKKPVLPEFTIYDIDGYYGYYEQVTVTGHCSDGGTWFPVLSYVGNPSSSYYRISGDTATATVPRDVSSTDKNGQLNVAFHQTGVTKVVIEFSFKGRPPSEAHKLIISPVRLRQIPPPPPVNEDNLSFVKEVRDTMITTCDFAEYSFYIHNSNCDPKYVMFRDTLPDGMTWEAGIGMSSVEGLNLASVRFNDYEGTDTLRIDSVLVPGATTLRLTATARVDTGAVPAGDPVPFDNHAWIEYRQTVNSVPFDRKLRSVDRETLAGETRFKATREERQDTVKTDMLTDRNRYIENDVITVSIAIDNPNDAVKDAYLNILFNAGFTYVNGSFTSTITPAAGITPPVAVAPLKDSVLSIAGAASGLTGFTIPAGRKDVITFKLLAPPYSGRVRKLDEYDQPTDYIEDLGIRYEFSTDMKDLCVIRSMTGMSGTTQTPYRYVTAHDDRVVTFPGVPVKTGVLANDSIHAPCRPLGMEETGKAITVPPKFGVATVVGANSDSLLYIPNSNQVWYDTLTYRIVCESDTSWATVYIRVTLPDNVSDKECYTEIPSVTWSIRESFTSDISKQKMTAYTTPIVGDLDDDGVPEIIVYNFLSSNDPRTVDSVYVFWGKDRANPTRFKIPTTSYMHPMGALAKVEIGGAMTPTLVFQATDGYLYAYNPVTGLPVSAWNGGNVSGRSDAQINDWVAATGATAVTPQAIGFADFDGDGKVEVYASRSVWAAENGKLLVRGTGNKGYAQSEGANGNYKHYYTVAVDVDEDGIVDLAAGTNVYDVHTPYRDGTHATNTMTVKYEIPGQLLDNGLTITDGTTITADINKDGKTDIIVSSNNGGDKYGILVWDPRTETVIATGGSTGVDYPAMPFAGNIDQDPHMEILYITVSRLHGWRYNGTTTLQCPYTMTHTDGSGATGITLFDFDSNGTPELVYRDQDNLRIMNADAATNKIENLKTFPCGSGTYKEYPIVADVDGEGSSAILVMGGTSGATSSATLRIYKSDGEPWAPARKVWNQYNYNAVNINEDLTVPQYQFNPATFFPGPDGSLGTPDDIQPYNAFLQQQTELNKDGEPLWLAPNVKIADSPAPAFHYFADGDSLLVTLQITNTGDKIFPKPLYVAAYKDAAASTNRMAVDSLLTDIDVSDTIPVTVTVRDFSNFQPLTRIVFRINDRGEAAYVREECDADLPNNEQPVPFADLLMAHNDRIVTFPGMPVKIAVLANDSIHAPCSPRLENTGDAITVLPQLGSAAVVVGAGSDSILYTPNSASGYDTLTYRIVCGSDTSRANVYIRIVDAPDNISTADCYLPAPSTIWDIEQKAISDSEVFWLATPFAGDLDGDGRVEVVAPNNYSTGDVTSLLVFNDSLKLIRTITPKTNVTLPNYATMTFLIADVDNDGKGEIVTATKNNTLLCFSHEGNEKWAKETDSYTASFGDPSLIVADINSDGYAEILAIDNIYDGETGTLLVKLPAGGRGFAQGGPKSSMPVFADMDNDGLQEVVAGNTVYKITITNRTGTAGNTATVLAQINAPAGYTFAVDGFTSVADIDLDGDLDVIVTGGHASNTPTAIFYVWDGATSAQIGQTLSFSSDDRRISRAFAGDIDGNGRPDIAFTYTYYIEAYSYNPTANTFIQLWKQSTSDQSGATTMSMFDFNQDGEVEVIYRDKTHLRIINRQGNNVTSIPCYSETHTEYPIVVDLDKDGHADILVSGSSTYMGNSPYGTYIFRFSSKTPGQWAPTRSVWNQHGYNTTNINDDLSVPRYPMNPAMSFDAGADGELNTPDDIRPFNGFLMQQTLLQGRNGAPIWLTPDVSPDSALSSITDYGDSTIVRVAVKNRGDAAIGPPVYVTLYMDAVAPENYITTDSANIQIDTLKTGYVDVRIDTITKYPALNIIARVNDSWDAPGSAGKTFPRQEECDSGNNELAIFNTCLTRSMEKHATLRRDNELLLVHDGWYANPVSVLYGDTVEYKIKTVNPVAGTVIIRDTLPFYLKYAATVHTSRPASQDHGTSADESVRDTLSWILSGVTAGTSDSVIFRATPASGANASQPLYVNRAWVEIIAGTKTYSIPTGNRTYHQGAGTSVVTFSAGRGGSICNADPQAVDYSTTARAGVLVAVDEGYDFAGWSHDAYTSYRGREIAARSGILHYDTLAIYGDVELRADFALNRYPIRYCLNGAENAGANPPEYTVESAAITLAPPRKAGDVFTGWTGSNGDVPQETVTIPAGSTGDRAYYANFLYSGREAYAEEKTKPDKIWATGNEAYIRTSRSGSIVRVYTPDGVLRRQHTILSAGVTKFRLEDGIYIITLNNGAGQKVFIE
jgi:uncharacterized repeat protein (TIGR02543 family)